jgi:hypothetical protein
MPDMSIVPETAPQPLTPQPAAYTPSAFGGDVAQAMTGAANMAGEQIMARHRMDLKNYADAENADGQVRIANLRDQMAAAQADVQKAAQGGGLDPRQYHDAMIGKFDELSAGLASGANSAAVQRQLNAQLGVMRAEVSTQARDWQTVNLANQAIRSSGEAEGAFDQQSAQATTPAQMMQIQQQSADFYHGLTDLSEDQRHTLTIQGVQKRAAIFAEGIAQNDPGQALAYLKDGTLFHLGLRGEQAHTIERMANAGVKAQEAEARQQAAIVKTQFNMQADLFTKAAEASGEVDLPMARSLQQQALTLGEPVRAQALQMLVENQGFAKQYKAMAINPAEMQRHIAALAAEKNPSETDQRELHYAQGHANEWVSKFNADPAGYAATMGVPGAQPPPVSLNDPHSLQALEVWRQGMAKRTGLADFPMFPDAMVTPMQQQLAQGGQSRQDLVHALDAFSDNDRALAARQIAPQDYTFQHEVMLAPDARAMLQYGREAQKGNGAYWPERNSKDYPDQAQWLADADARVDFAMRMLNPKDAQAIKQNMRDILAGQYSRQGKPNGYGVTENDLRLALAQAMGGQIKNGRQYGGIAEWGGAHGSYVIIPETMTAGDFSRAWSADYFRQKRAGHGPVNPDGSDFALSGSTPVAVGGNRYKWVNSAGTVQRRGGGDYITDLSGER